AGVLHGARLDGEGSHPDLLHEALGIDGEHHHADAPGHRGGQGHDGVAGESRVVTAGGGHVHHDGHHGNLATRLEDIDLPVDQVGGGDGAPGAVDAHDEG